MPLTFKEFRSIVAPYAGRAGKCAIASEVATFSRQVMEYLLYSGSESGVKKLCIQAHRGCLSLPPEVELPIKVRVDNRSADLWSKWHTFHSDDPKNWDRCSPASDVLREEGSRTPLAYDLPTGGAVLGVMATCDEDPNAGVIIQSQDLSGREVYTTHQGEQIAGEKFSLKKNEIRYGRVLVGNVTGVIKPQTNGYVVLYAVDPQRNRIIKFLADWNPSEEKPLYRKFKVDLRGCDHVANISMLCRVRLKDSYLDNELTLFDNSLAVLIGAQRVQAEVNNDIQTAGYKKGAVEDLLEKEGGYKKISGNPVDVYHPLSGGAIRNIVGGRSFGRFGRFRGL